jgi:hypothetical protein
MQLVGREPHARLTRDGSRRPHPLSELFKEMHVEGRAQHLGNLPGIDAVESELRDGDRATGRLDAEECLAVRSPCR